MPKLKDFGTFCVYAPSVRRNCGNDFRQGITAVWAIPEKLFIEWSDSLSGDADYYAEFQKLIEPFRETPVGKIVEISKVIYYTGHTLDELIRKYQPDVVVCVRDYQQLLLETGNGK